MQRGGHRADAETKLEAEGDVDEDDRHGDADREDGVPLDLLADGGADLARAALHQAGLRIGFLERREQRVGLAVGGLQLELLAAATEVVDVGRADLADAVGLGHLADQARIDLRGEIGRDLVAAGEVDAVDAVALVDYVGDADYHERHRADGGGLAVTHEVHVEILQHAAHRDLLEEV